MTRELTEDEVVAEASEIELRLIRGTSSQADRDRYPALKASRQLLLRDRSCARETLDSLDDKLRGMIGGLAEAHLAEIEAALLTAPLLMAEQPDLPQQEQAQPDAAPSEAGR